MNKISACLVLTICLLAGCATTSKKTAMAEPEVVVIRDSGTQLYVWEPPMVDVVEIPAGLDPEGIYYRPEHQQIVEIKQGKWVLKP
ncbi:MAG: hypothetical protein NZO16_03765 [Deltaproteobacteria bacterium]|nr:hypothetical protein [Deltaproteobacteria bacterium]